MTQPNDIKKSLINVDDSILVIIDIQDSFLKKYEPKAASQLLEKACWFIKLAKMLDVPMVAMAEDIEDTGTLNQDIINALPAGQTIHNKNSFGLAGDKNILQDVKSSGRQTAILMGMETDVCVAQSALGLMAEGFRVVVLHDATATTQGDQQIGLRRMGEAGALISSVKATSYECLRTVEKTIEVAISNSEFEEQLPDCLAL